ncbi:MAG: nitrate reductase [Chloroflexi bacterium]|nr:MAG: nitrate reductase [Chloroflexota bacterium]
MSAANSSSGETKVIKSDCILCVSGCGIDAYVQDGKLVKVEGMAEHPLNKGKLCPRGYNLVEYANAEERLKYPMKKEDGEWKRISWDEALDTIAAKLMKIKEEYGAHAVSIFNGSMAVENIELASFTQRFKGAFGTPNLISVESICFRIRVIAHLLTYGRFTSEDPETAACIVLWGNNPDQSRFMWADMIRERVANAGLRLIAIDPKRTEMAKLGLHLQVRPGTDVALGLGMLNVIISEGLYDREFVDQYTIGFDQLKEHVKEYPPEKVAEITWVPASDIKHAARMMATNKPMCIIPGTCSLAHSGSALQAERLLCIIQAVTGNLDVPGGWAMTPLVKLTDLRIPVEEAPVGAAEYPVFYKTWGRPVPYGQSMPWADQVLSEKPYPIKALIVTGGNPALTMPETRKFVAALNKLDFVAVINPFMTETAELADIVLPACTFLEKMGLGMVYGINAGLPYLILRKPLIDPPGEAWADWKFWTELARRMGLGEYFPWNTDREVVSMLLEPSGVTIEQLEENPCGIFYAEKNYNARENFGFRTPSKKVELYSQALKDEGHDPIPTHREPVQSPISTPELAREYPLLLVTGARMKEFTHSQLRMMTSMRRSAPEPFAEIHPAAARDNGIVDGEMIYVETRKGSIQMKARVTEDVAPRVVSIPHGWAIANANELTDLDARDPVSGYPLLKGLLCRIRKAN